MSKYLRISRPRFWPYLLGPFFIGAVAASPHSLITWVFICAVSLYFSLPANLLIYGVNDIFDSETDKLNPKKATYETLLNPADKKILLMWIGLLNLPFVGFSLLYSWPLATKLSLVLFIFLGVFYSAKPIRAKGVPLLDTVFNALYIMPAVFSYTLLTNTLPNTGLVIAAVLWCMAMHAFSAIPDIAADKGARLNTIATWLGRKGTLMFCLSCYVLAGFLVALTSAFAGVFLGSIYVGIMLMAWSEKTQEGLFKIYTFFPIINTIVGAALFISLFVIKV